MCGIVGKVFARGAGVVDEGLVRDMCGALAHRGPDDEGVYLDAEAGLGMRRLKVIDLEGGRQPMSNEDGSVWVVFNGEIYNFRDLRTELEEQGHRFATASDTETIVHLYEEVGLDFATRLRGMFAIAVWDSRRRRLVLARDRLGQKPLYYAHTAQGVTFASELGALMRDRSIDDDIDLKAVDEYLSYLFVPHPRTIYSAVRKLPAGSCAEYVDGRLQIERYWDVTYRPTTFDNLAKATVVDRLDELLRDAVEARMIADVPLGAFLSGGLDSSLIVAMMQRSTSTPVRTFCVGFKEESYSELEHARVVSEALGTQHEECIVDYDVQDLLPDLVDHFGEPFADSSAIPEFHLCRATRRSVTVALSGDGGDELFGGYRRYVARRWADLYNRWPSVLGRAVLEGIATRVPEPTTYYGRSWRKKTRRFLEFANAIRQAPETSWAFFLTAADKALIYQPEYTTALEGEADSFEPYFARQGHAGPQAMLWLDQMTYLPDDILVKVDRMSMASSLEVRSPFLDHHVVEFTAGLGREWKFGWRETKRVLRSVARRYLPDTVIERPKQGFAVPLAGWLQGPLRGWMEDLLLCESSDVTRFVRPDALRALTETHLSGRRDLSQQLWALMVLAVWHQRCRR